MPDFPFKIPPSLSSYVEQFESDPQKSISRLETHLKKRGLDAAGYFVLAYLYHKQGNKAQALENASKAKSYAPGSPLFENLHFYLLHPKEFKAVIPNQATKDGDSYSDPGNANHDLNLDSLIAKLTAAESLKIDLPLDRSDDNMDLSLPAQMVSDLASETLALIYEKQGEYKQAIKSHKTMQKVKPKKFDKYQKEIERLNKLIEDEGKAS